MMKNYAQVWKKDKAHNLSIYLRDTYYVCKRDKRLSTLVNLSVKKSIIYFSITWTYNTIKWSTLISSVTCIEKKQNMATTLRFFYAMLLFLSLFLLVKEVSGKLYFHCFKFPCLLYSSYTIFYLILITLFLSLLFFIFLLQQIFLSVKLMLIVDKF